MRSKSVSLSSTVLQVLPVPSVVFWPSLSPSWTGRLGWPTGDGFLSLVCPFFLPIVTVDQTDFVIQRVS